MLSSFLDWLLYGLLSLDSESLLWQSVHFFLYDTVKILVLVFVMILVVGFLRTYIPQKKVKKWLSGKRTGVGNFLSSIFGAITPFCSCSSIPLFLSFLEAGIPLGVTFSFLITSPLINEYVVVLMLGFFGWKITALYVLSGILIGTFAGMILGRMGLEKYLVKDIVADSIKEKVVKTFSERLRFGWDEAISITRKIWLWVVVAIGLASVIHNYVPEEAIHSIMNSAGVFAVPIAVILGVPMYGSCAAIVPIALVLFQKGVPLGTALAFMMATAALSFPEAIILRRAMKLKLIAIFFGVVTLAILLTGYLFNLLQHLF